MTAQLATIGHNAPPATANPLRDRLAEQYADLVQRRRDLEGEATDLPDTIFDDDGAGRVSDTIKRLGALEKQAEALRVSEKEPYLEAGRVVDGWFKQICDAAKATRANIQRPLDTYLRAKAEDERKRREIVEATARAEAERLAAAAKTESGLNRAIAQEDAANRAAKEASAKAAELSRTRSDLGSVASLRTTWEFEITDANAVPRQYLMVNDGAIKAAVKGGNRSIPGVRIYEKTTAQVR